MVRESGLARAAVSAGEGFDGRWMVDGGAFVALSVRSVGFSDAKSDVPPLWLCWSKRYAAQCQDLRRKSRGI